MKELVRQAQGINDMGPWADRIYAEPGIFIRHRASYTCRAGLIENYYVAREIEPVSWIGPFGTYERARAFLLPMNSIYLAHQTGSG